MIKARFHAFPLPCAPLRVSRIRVALHPAFSVSHLPVTPFWLPAAMLMQSSFHVQGRRVEALMRLSQPYGLIDIAIKLFKKDSGVDVLQF